MALRYVSILLLFMLRPGFADAPPRSMTLDEALALATHAPAAQVARQFAEASATHTRAMGTWAPAELRVAPGFTGDGSLDYWQASLEQRLPLWSVRGREQQAWQARLAERQAWARHTESEAQRVAARLWYLTAAAQARELVLHRTHAELVALMEKVARAAKAGEATRVEVAQLQALLADAKLATLDAEGEAFEAGLALGEALGLGGQRIVCRGEGAPPALAKPAAGSAWAVVAARQRARAAQGVLSVLAAAARPELIVGLGAQSTRPLDAATGWTTYGLVTLGVAFAMPGAGQQGGRERTEAHAQVVTASAEAVAAAQHHATRLAQARHEVEHTHEVLTQIETALVPASTQAADLARKGFALGETTATQLRQAVRDELLAQARFVDARFAHHAAQLELHLLLTLEAP